MAAKAPTIIKIGGSILSNEEDYRHAARRLANAYRKGPTWAVVSAAGGVTDRLELLAHDPDPSIIDRLVEQHAELAGRPLSHQLVEDLRQSLSRLPRHGVRSLTWWGERASAEALRARLEDEGVRVDIMELMSRTRPRPDASGILPGFYVRDRHGRPRSLPRGGSDISALILAVRLGASEVRFWKRGGGLYQDGTLERPLMRTDYDALLQRLGGAIRPIHPAAVRIARRHHIRLVLESADGLGPRTSVEAATALDAR